jgi:quinol-cytochrome oxidoreductase complex cytochrome b subunit
MLLLLDQTGAAAMRVAAAVHMPRMVLHGSNLPGRGGVQHLLVLATFVQKEGRVRRF